MWKNRARHTDIDKKALIEIFIRISKKTHYQSLRNISPWPRYKKKGTVDHFEKYGIYHELKLSGLFLCRTAQDVADEMQATEREMEEV